MEDCEPGLKGYEGAGVGIEGGGVGERIVFAETREGLVIPGCLLPHPLGAAPAL